MKINRKAARAFDRKIRKLAKKAKPAPFTLSRIPVRIRIPIAKLACSGCWIVSSLLSIVALWIVGYERRSPLWEVAMRISEKGLDFYRWGRTGINRRDRDVSKAKVPRAPKGVTSIDA